MAIITDQSDRYEIPHEPGEWVMLKSLRGSQMDEAEQEKTIKAMKRYAPILEAMGPEMQQQSKATAKDDKDTDKDTDSITVRRADYDPETLIKYALAGWSYPEEPDDNPADMLDNITRDWLWDTIVEANTRPPASAPGGEPSLN